jgi:hypothetical protein
MTQSTRFRTCRWWSFAPTWPRKSKTVAIDSCPRQRNISIRAYEIILMDNGSAKVLDEPMQKILSNLNYIYLMREALQP